MFLLGLWPLAAALAAGFMLVSTAHFTGERRSAAHLAAALTVALAWLGADRAASAWLFHQHQQRVVASEGLLLADHAVITDSDNPDTLIDAALMAETGAGGVVGAARVQMRSGITVMRVLGDTRVIRAPLWAVVVWLGLRAAIVALLVARAFEQLRGEPVCAVCKQWLRRERMGWLDPVTFDDLKDDWLTGKRSSPEVQQQPGQLLVFRDTCPTGHSVAPGFEIRRARGRGLGRSRPGTLAALSPAVALSTETVAPRDD